MNIREGQTNQNAWQRIIFPISKCSGKILLSHFKDSSLYNKASIEDIKLSFTLIEKKTHHFRRIRFCFIIKVVLIIITIILLFSSLLFFFEIKQPIVGVVLVLLSLVFLCINIFCLTNRYKNIIKADLRRLYPSLLAINNKLFVENSLYLMISPDFNCFSLYIIPTFLKLNVQINNFIKESALDNSRNDITINSNENLKEKEDNNIIEILNDYLSTKATKKLTNKETNKENSFIDVVI